jgi:hypothetical protein
MVIFTRDHAGRTASSDSTSFHIKNRLENRYGTQCEIGTFLRAISSAFSLEKAPLCNSNSDPQKAQKSSTHADDRLRVLNAPNIAMTRKYRRRAKEDFIQYRGVGFMQSLCGKSPILIRSAVGQSGKFC